MSARVPAAAAAAAGRYATVLPKPGSLDVLLESDDEAQDAGDEGHFSSEEDDDSRSSSPPAPAPALVPVALRNVQPVRVVGRVGGAAGKRKADDEEEDEEEEKDEEYTDSDDLPIAQLRKRMCGAAAAAAGQSASASECEEASELDERQGEGAATSVEDYWRAELSSTYSASVSGDSDSNNTKRKHGKSKRSVDTEVNDNESWLARLYAHPQEGLEEKLEQEASMLANKRQRVTQQRAHKARAGQSFDEEMYQRDRLLRREFDNFCARFAVAHRRVMEQGLPTLSDTDEFEAQCSSGSEHSEHSASSIRSSKKERNKLGTTAKQLASPQLRESQLTQLNVKFDKHCTENLGATHFELTEVCKVLGLNRRSDAVRGSFNTVVDTLLAQGEVIRGARNAWTLTAAGVKDIFIPEISKRRLRSL